jgi:hypothetical protein
MSGCIGTTAPTNAQCERKCVCDYESDRSTKQPTP